MPDQVDFNHNLEPRDAAGMVPASNAAQDLIAERDQLRADVNRLEAEVAELKRSLDVAKQEVSDKAAITAERDQYLKALYALMREDLHFDPEELADMERNSGSLGDVIAEIENDLRSRGLLDAG